MSQEVRTVKLDQTGVVVGLSQDAYDQTACLELEASRRHRPAHQILSLTNLVFSDVWIVAMLTLVPLICLLSVLLGIIVSSRVNDARTAQQLGSFIVIPIIAIAVAGFFSGQPTFSMEQVIIGDLIVAVLIGFALVAGNWIFEREQILTRLG